MTDDLEQYQYALDIFNQTVANMSSFVDTARADAINELNGLHAGYTDPVDDGAYNLTMYGMNQISGVTDHVFDTVGNVSNYFVNNSSTVTLQTEHTSVSGAVVSAPIDSFSSLFTHVASDPGNFVHANSTGFMILGIIFSVLLGKFIFLRR
jgi:hypothetical protein